MELKRQLPSYDSESQLLAALHSSKRVSGLTHNFYRYPARMAPEFAREVIAQFSQPGDTVLDPFMGGGTTLVEALAQGRRSIGVDLNPLATFVTTVKTTPLSARDATAISKWIEIVRGLELVSGVENSDSSDPRVKNMPPELMHGFGCMLDLADNLPYPRQRRFVRSILLRLGQWAIDCKSEVPEWPRLQDELFNISRDMLIGLDNLVHSAAAHGVKKNQMTNNRTILLRSSEGLEMSLNLNEVHKPQLVLTSPPYPAVHVLYNRWQVHGRKETPAPYWLIGAPDGRGASYFTMGSRSSFGIDNYFRSLTAVFRSVRAVVAPNALIVQLVSFSDTGNQLDAFLQAMDYAGFQETPTTARRDERWRTVPNRKWYNEIAATRGSASELLLFHRPK